MFYCLWLYEDKLSIRKSDAFSCKKPDSLFKKVFTQFKVRLCASTSLSTIRALSTSLTLVALPSTTEIYVAAPSSKAFILINGEPILIPKTNSVTGFNGYV